MEIGTTITPERFRELLNEVIKECLRRKYDEKNTGYDVYHYGITGQQPLSMYRFTEGEVIPDAVFKSIEEPMTLINSDDNPSSGDNSVIKDQTLTNLEANLAIYKTYPVQSKTTGCKANCTGLCYIQCTGGCMAGCSGTCEGTCSGCTGCTGSCEGTCSGRCTRACANNCSGDCEGDCGGSSCRGSCDGGCSGCSSSCSKGCGGCSGVCSGSASVGNDPSSYKPWD